MARSPRGNDRFFTRTVAVLMSVLALIGGGAVPVQAASRPIEVENLRMGFGSSNSFKIGTWTPVWVQLRGGDERFSGFLDVVVSDDDGMPASFRQPVELGAKESQRFTAYVRPGGRDSEVTLRLFDARGRRVAEVSQERAMPNPPLTIMPEETLILTMGQPQGVDQLPNLPGFQGGGPGRRSVTAPINVARVDVQGGQLPGRWYGFDAAQALVIDTTDRATLQALDSLRGQAVVDWVKRGGHLVVAVGANWQALRDSVLEPILPAVPSGQERVPSLESLDTFAGANKQITPPGTPPVMVAKLEGVEKRGGTVLSILANLPLVVRGAYGFGRVTLIGVDVDQKLFSDWADRGLFWVRALDLRHDRPDPSGSGAVMAVGGRFYQSGVSDLSSQLRVALEQFPGVKLIPFGWVAFFIFLYILLIGPGDYLFLKQVLKRMELTWITFPTIVVTVSLVAYYAAYRLKGNELLINKVDVIDVDQTRGLLRGNTWMSLFSPQNRDYTIGVVPQPPDLDHEVPLVAAPDPSGEPPRPPAGTEVVMSWFSVPENQFGAMGGSNRRFNFAGSGYTYQPVGGVERLVNVRVPIWSTKSVTAQWFGPTSSLVDSDVRPVGVDRLAGTVTNRQNYPLEDAILAFGKQVYLLGTIAPGETVRVELSGDRNLSGHLKSKQSNYMPEQYWNRNLRINRADLMLGVMFHDSETSRTGDRPMGNTTLQNLDLTGQLALGKPMLVAQIKRPGAQLALDNVPSSPKINQTTLLRLILPLK